MHHLGFILGCAFLVGVFGCNRPAEPVPELAMAPTVVPPVGAEVADRPGGPPADRDDKEDRVTVVCKTRYYTEGWMRDDGKGMRLFDSEDPERQFQVDGFVLVVTGPAEYAGQIVTMHHDGVLASGDPYKVFAIGRRYEINVPKSSLGRFNFRLCSIDGPRKQMPE